MEFLKYEPIHLEKLLNDDEDFIKRLTASDEFYEAASTKRANSAEYD